MSVSKYPERRQFTVNQKMYCVTEEELREKELPALPDEDVTTVWESMEPAPCGDCEFKAPTGRCIAFDQFIKS